MVCFSFQALMCTRAASGGTPASVFGGPARYQLAERGDMSLFLHYQVLNPVPSAGMHTLASLLLLFS